LRGFEVAVDWTWRAPGFNWKKSNWINYCEVYERLSKKWTTNLSEINISELKNGIYFIRLKNEIY